MAQGCPQGRTVPQEGLWEGPRAVPKVGIVPAGEVPFNHEILREAYALCHCLPVLSTDKFKTDFYDVSDGWGGSLGSCGGGGGQVLMALLGHTAGTELCLLCHQCCCWPLRYCSRGWANAAGGGGGRGAQQCSNPPIHPC